MKFRAGAANYGPLILAACFYKQSCITNTNKLINLHIVYGFLDATAAELKSCRKRPCGLQSLNNLLHGPLQREFGKPCSSACGGTADGVNGQVHCNIIQ